MSTGHKRLETNISLMAVFIIIAISLLTCGWTVVKIVGISMRNYPDAGLCPTIAWTSFFMRY